jgi:head-tail adaptor
MQTRRLIHRVSFKKFVEVADGHDGFTQTPLFVRTRVAAEVAALQGADLERAQAIDPRAAYLVTVRYWQTHLDDLVGGRVVAIWHDGVRDRSLEVVEPPREVVPRVELAMHAKEAA